MRRRDFIKVIAGSLKGDKPKDLPVQQAARLEMGSQSKNR